jgi:hypothetical protein
MCRPLYFYFPMWEEFATSYTSPDLAQNILSDRLLSSLRAPPQIGSSNLAIFGSLIGLVEAPIPNHDPIGNV